MTSDNNQNKHAALLTEQERNIVIASFATVFDDVMTIDTDGAIMIIDEAGQTIVSQDLGHLDWVGHLAGTDWAQLKHQRPLAITRCLTSRELETSHEEDLIPNLGSVHCFAMPADIQHAGLKKSVIVGLFLPANDHDSSSAFILKSIVYKLQYEVKQMFEQLYAREWRLRQIVFETVNLFHAKNEGDAVITDAVQSLERMFPHVVVELFLSQDNQSSKLAVKPLVLDAEEQRLCAQAFMSGTIKIDDKESGEKIVAVPLSGKQGVYGVFQLSFPAVGYQDSDLEFVYLLVDAAGSAFENAKLYEQSTLLIGELRLINEITRRLNQSLRLKDIFTYASKELINIFDANYGCVLKLDKANDRFIVEASNLPTFTNEIISTDYGFSGVVYKSREPLIISDYSPETNVESKLMVETNSRSLIATPILVNSEVVGAIFVTHREPHYFTYDNYKLLQVISVHIGLAIANASLHAEVRRMVITDNLTGLYARNYLDEQISQMQKKDYCGALILVDVDDFKKVNDTYGHQVGDKVLIQVGEIIKANIRDSDIAARWGGEELAIYLPLSKLEHTKKVAERIRQSIYDETDPRVSVSCGISLWSWEDETISVESLFYRADMALYKAKNEGRNQIVIG